MARRVLVLLGLLAGVIALAPRVSALDANSPSQAAFLQLFLTILIFALIIGILVHVLLLLAVKWFRDSPRWRPPSRNRASNDRRLELGWTVGPVIILMIVAILTLAALPGIERPPHVDYYIQVIGSQWVWRFEYPDFRFPNGTTVSVPGSSSTLYIQQGYTYQFNVTTTDVVHSFYVPALDIAIDANPGVTDIAWVRADQAGTYSLQCKEFCGLGHSQMTGQVVVFGPGTQPVPYGPPAAIGPGGGGTPTGAIIDLEFKQSGGPSTDRPWSIQPSQVNLGEGFNVTFRVWNNESGTHQFRIGAPYNILGAVMPGQSATPDIINFRTNYTGAIDYWCDIPGHRALGMEGVMNVSGPQNVSVVLTDTSVQPSTLTFGLGWTVNVTVENRGSQTRVFEFGPPYNAVVPSTGTIPVGGSASRTLTFNSTVSATWFGSSDPVDRANGIEGLLTVTAVGAAPPPAAAPQGFPVVPFTFGLVGIGGVAAVAFDMKLARDARRRQRFPPGEE